MTKQTVIRFLFVLFYSVPLLSFAQVTVSPNVQAPPQGFMLEAHSGSIACALNRMYGHPISYVARTNRTDLFVSHAADVKKCLYLLMKEQAKPEYKQISYPLAQMPIIVPQYYGEVGQVTCTKVHNERGVPLLYEFFFPYLEKRDIPVMASKEVLQSCLDAMVSNDAPPYKVQKDFQKES
jgi:hypothetical protein